MDELLVKLWDVVSALSLPERPQMVMGLATIAIFVAVVGRDMITILTTVSLSLFAILATFSQVGEVAISIAAFAVLHAFGGLDKRLLRQRIAKLDDDVETLLASINSFLQGLDRRSRENDLWRASEAIRQDTDGRNSVSPMPVENEP